MAKKESVNRPWSSKEDHVVDTGHGLMVQTWPHGIDMDSRYRHGLLVLTKIHGIENIDKDSWYRKGLMVLTTPMVLTQRYGIVLVLLNHTRTRGQSVARMQDFLAPILLLGTLQTCPSLIVCPSLDYCLVILTFLPELSPD